MTNRPRGALVLGLVLAVAATVAPPPVAARPHPGPVASPGVRFTVTTANVQVVLGPVGARADLALAARRSSVVLAQENWGRQVAQLAPTGWSAYQPARPVPGCRGNATMWRRAVWRLGGHWAALLHRSELGNRCATVTVLVHRQTGVRVPFVNVHLLPGVDANGHPRPRPVRVATFHRSVHRVLDVARSLRSRFRLAVIGGDWNVDWPDDHRVRAYPFPYRHLWRAWNSNWGKLPWTRPTHGSRRIDQVWWNERRGVWPVRSRTVGHTRSDHRFLRVTIRVPVPASATGR